MTGLFKRRLLQFIIVIVAFFLQCTLFKSIALASVSPNVLIILTAVFGFALGERDGIFTGFFCGIFVDIFFGDTIGLYALIYVYIGFFNGFLRQFFYNEDIKLPLIMTGASELLYGLTVYAAFFLLRGKFEFQYYLVHIIIPELVYTTGITLIIYRPLSILCGYLDNIEKRSADNLV